MAHNDRVVMDDAQALKTLRVHYGMLFGCSPTDLCRPGWSVLTARAECDPVALLFGRRSLLSIISPVAPADLTGRRAGLVAVAPELRMPIAALLRELPPERLFAAGGNGLRTLHTLVTSASPRADLRIVSPDDCHTHIRFVSRAGYAPYIGQWQEWIEPLDEGNELEPVALSLLARYSGGVYVVRDEGGIISHAGIRPHSPHVAEIGVRTDAEALRGHGLARAVVSRATKAVFAADRLPIYRHGAAEIPAARVAEALGYRVYADAVEYGVPTL